MPRIGYVTPSPGRLPSTVLGFQQALAPWTPGQTEDPAMDERFRRAEVWSDAHVRLQHAVHRQKQADRHRSETPVFYPGDRV
jgi:hypothetical protein